jgi:hypothetical protein
MVAGGGAGAGAGAWERFRARAAGAAAMSAVASTHPARRAFVIDAAAMQGSGRGHRRQQHS